MTRSLRAGVFPHLESHAHAAQTAADNNDVPYRYLRKCVDKLASTAGPLIVRFAAGRCWPAGVEHHFSPVVRPARDFDFAAAHGFAQTELAQRQPAVGGLDVTAATSPRRTTAPAGTVNLTAWPTTKMNAGEKAPA